MKKLKYTGALVASLVILSSCTDLPDKDPGVKNAAVYEFQDVETRWASFENIKAEKGLGGMENKGAKGHPMDRIKAGGSVTLLETEGPGVINRIWATIDNRSAKMLRSLKIEMFWDNCETPAVSAPFGDFFGVTPGRETPFENALFADPEGRSFISYVQMPFKKSAKVVITNDGDRDLNKLFFDINFTQLKGWNPGFLYFHCYWSRDTATTIGEDFQVLPTIEGKGRFLGSNIGIITNPWYGNHWWGEGEVKMFIDGDGAFPTLVGTGTEDYIGTAWGQGSFCQEYSGCLVSDMEKGQWAFYRYHIPDPVFFHTDIAITLQQIGGAPKKEVKALVTAGVPVKPISIRNPPDFYKLMEGEYPEGIDDPRLPEGWTNYYRSDDVSATAYFYLDKPGNNLPKIQDREIRTLKVARKN